MSDTLQRGRVETWWHRTPLRPAVSFLGGANVAAWAHEADGFVSRFLLLLWALAFFYRACELIYERSSGQP